MDRKMILFVLEQNLGLVSLGSPFCAGDRTWALYFGGPFNSLGGPFYGNGALKI